MRSKLAAYYLDRAYVETGGENRIAVESMSHSALASHAGEAFNFLQRFTVNAATPVYILLENPSDSGVDIEFVERFFQTDSDGADFLVLWDYDVTGATKTSLTVYNENNNYRTDKLANLEVSVLNDITIDAATGIATVNGAYTPVDAGIVRDSAFITASGVGNNSSGDISPESGARIYGEGTGALIKVTSRGNDNLTAIGYTFQEN